MTPEKPERVEKLSGSPVEGIHTLKDGTRLRIKMPTFEQIMDYLQVVGEQVKANGGVLSSNSAPYGMIALICGHTEAYIRGIPADDGVALLTVCAPLMQRIEPLLRDFAHVSAQLGSSLNQNLHS